MKIAVAAALGLTLVACGQTDGTQELSDEPRQLSAQESAPPLNCRQTSQLSEDRVGEPAGGADSAEDLGHSYASEGQEIRVVTDGDDNARI